MPQYRSSGYAGGGGEGRWEMIGRGRWEVASADGGDNRSSRSQDSRSSGWGGVRSSGAIGSAGPAQGPQPALATPPKFPAETAQSSGAPRVDGAGALGDQQNYLDDSAGVRPAAPDVYYLDYFQNYAAAWNGNYKQHNAALMWRRQKLEESNAFLVFDTAVAESIPCIIKDKKAGQHQDNTDWSFSDTEETKWLWLEMVAQLDQATMELVVCGPGGDRSRGLVSCQICACPNSYDHNRQAKRVRDGAGKQTVCLQRWDVLLLRDDGSGIRLHPEWSSTKFRVYEFDPRSDPVPPPGKGLGKSDGHGTFARYKGVDMQTQGRFDASKGSHLPPKWRTPK